MSFLIQRIAKGFKAPGRNGLRSAKDGIGAKWDGIGEGNIDLGPGAKSNRAHSGHAAALGRDLRFGFRIHQISFVNG
jgi:hypothetical protein